MQPEKKEEKKEREEESASASAAEVQEEYTQAARGRAALANAAAHAPPQPAAAHLESRAAAWRPSHGRPSSKRGFPGKGYDEARKLKINLRHAPQVNVVYCKGLRGDSTPLLLIDSIVAPVVAGLVGRLVLGLRGLWRCRWRLWRLRSR
mgnify:CR=1 FL=1